MLTINGDAEQSDLAKYLPKTGAKHEKPQQLSCWGLNRQSLKEA